MKTEESCLRWGLYDLGMEKGKQQRSKEIKKIIKVELHNEMNSLETYHTGTEGKCTECDLVMNYTNKIIEQIDKLDEIKHEKK